MSKLPSVEELLEIEKDNSYTYVLIYLSKLIPQVGKKPKQEIQVLEVWEDIQNRTRKRLIDSQDIPGDLNTQIIELDLLAQLVSEYEKDLNNWKDEFMRVSNIKNKIQDLTFEYILTSTKFYKYTPLPYYYSSIQYLKELESDSMTTEEFYNKVLKFVSIFNVLTTSEESLSEAKPPLPNGVT